MCVCNVGPKDLRRQNMDDVRLFEFFLSISITQLFIENVRPPNIYEIILLVKIVCPPFTRFLTSIYIIYGLARYNQNKTPC